MSALDSPKALLVRATKHLQDLEMEVADYSRRNSCVPFTEIDVLTGKVLFKINVTEDVPLQIATIVFDIVNEIRSALDYAVFAAASVITSLPDPSGTKFPFGRDAVDAIGDFDRNKPPAGLDELRDYIISVIQPYKNGRHDAFWRLNKLRNSNVHRHLAPAIASPGPMQITGDLYGFNSTSAWDDEKKVLTVFEADSAVGQKGMSAAPAIAFQQGSYFPGANVLRELSMLTSAVAWAVGIIEAKAIELRNVQV